MSGYTVRQWNYLLGNYFQDGQSAGSIVPGRVRDFVGTAESNSRASFNVKAYGAIGNGMNNPASANGFATLGALQAVYPFATSITNQMDWLAAQLCVNLASGLPNGGAVYFPATGTYYFDQELVLPDTPSVHLLGDGPNVSALYWPNDLGSGKYAIRTADDTNSSTYVNIFRLSILGPGYGQSLTMGSAFCHMHGVKCTHLFELQNDMLQGFYANIYIVQDHSGFSNLTSTNGYYNVYFGSDGLTSYGDHSFFNCLLAGASMASVGVSAPNGIDTVYFGRCHMGYAPYALYRESGSPSRPFVDNSSFVQVSMESFGNAAIHGVNTTDTITSCTFLNLTMAFEPGSTYSLSGQSSGYYIDVGVFDDNTFVGLDPFQQDGNFLGGSPVAFIRGSGSCSLNYFSRLDNTIGDVTSGIPFIVSNTANYNQWEGNGAGGIFLSAQGSTITSGQIVGQKYGQWAQPLGSATDIPFGVAVVGGATGTIIPVATHGITTVNKVASAISATKAVGASQATLGAAAPISGTYQLHLIGSATNDAASGAATVSVQLNVAPISYPQATPTVTGSKGGNAALASVITALVDAGLVIDNTT